MSVSYTKKQRAIAKEEKKGLFTISYVEPNGSSVSLQGVANKQTLKFIKESIAKIYQGINGEIVIVSLKFIKESMEKLL